MSIDGERRPLPKRLFSTRFFTWGTLILLVIVSASGAYFLFGSSPAPSAATKVDAARYTHTQPVSILPSAVIPLAKRYMTALIAGKYDVMWSMLHPDVQNMWPDEAAFSSYWRNRFNGFSLQGFSLGSSSTLTSWTNPETMKEYHQTLQIPISLQLTQKNEAGTKSTSAASQNANTLYRNLPFVVQDASIGLGSDKSQQWLILSGGPADLEAPILPPATPVTKTIDVPILMYHYISEVPAADKNNPGSYRPGLSVTPTVFAQQMDYFQALGYQTITMNQLFDALYYHGPLPAKPIIFSFDDGYVDAYTHAYPILKAHRFSAMFYIITGKVGWQGQATWAQLQEMFAHGMRMGSHTIDHRALGDVWQSSPADAQHELTQSKQTLESYLHTTIQQFCYPSGDPLNKDTALATTQIEIQSIFQLLNATGYVGATNDPVIDTTVQTNTDPFDLQRIRVQGSENIEQFKAEMNTFIR